MKRPPRFPFLRGRCSPLPLLLAVMGASCLSRPPVLAPPAEVASVEGFGHAVIEGEDATLKGKFSFLFKRPDLGRLDALDPLNRTVYFLVFRADEAYFVLPSKKVYAVDRPDSLLGRVLGFPVRPGEVIALLSDRWEAPPADASAGADDRWILEADEKGRTVRGTRNGMSFEVREFFRGAGVPKSVVFSDAAVTGRLKVISVRFNPPGRPEAFETRFVKVYHRKSWEEIQELLRDED